MYLQIETYLKMNALSNNFRFKIKVDSIYQKLWINYDVLQLCSETELKFAESNDVLSITNSNLSSFEIESILKEHLIEFEKI